MNRLKLLWSKTLLGYLWEEFRVRYRFKYVLPRVTAMVIDGVYLDLSRLSLKVRNRISMGIYEAQEKQLCHQFLTKEDSVLELGGAIGFLGLICQVNIGIRNYFVVEANPETIEILRTNYQLNGIEAAAWNLALAPHDGTVELDVASDFWDNSLITPEAKQAGARTVKVPGASFRTLLRQINQAVNVLIIDIEGAERFLELDAIPDAIDKIIIELHPKHLGPEATYNLIAGLIQRGFYVAREQEGTFAFLRRRSGAAGQNKLVSAPQPAALLCPDAWRLAELISVAT